jgi:hypothetical protein
MRSPSITYARYRISKRAFVRSRSITNIHKSDLVLELRCVLVFPGMNGLDFRTLSYHVVVGVSLRVDVLDAVGAPNIGRAVRL